MFSAFLPAASADAVKSMGAVIRSWRLHLRTTTDLAELARWINPVVRGWMNYYGHFYRTEIYALLRRINTYLVRWARRRFKRLRSFKRAQRWWRRGKSGAERGKVNVKIEFENTKVNNLGIALPKGKVRVFKKDVADDSLEFVGEDLIGHTPKNEKLSLYIGDAFDIVAEHTLIESKESWNRMFQTHKIELRNRKDEAVAVFVDERLPHPRGWKIEKATHKYEKKDAYTARFEVKIEADSQQVIEYTVSWPVW